MKKDTIQLAAIVVVLLAVIVLIVMFMPHDIVQIYNWYKGNLNYTTITALMAIESSFIPFPSEVVVPPAAYFAARNGDLNIYMVAFFATLGAFIGATVNYCIALPTAALGTPASSMRPRCRKPRPTSTVTERQAPSLAA